LNNQWFSKIAVWLVIALVLFTVFKQFDTRGGRRRQRTVGYSDFLEEVRGKRIKAASSRKARAAPKSSPSPPTTARCAPPPPTSIAAWSAT
jgi:cell division protease FtsH